MFFTIRIYKQGRQENHMRTLCTLSYRFMSNKAMISVATEIRLANLLERCERCIERFDPNT
jgi:hypothetical protein